MSRVININNPNKIRNQNRRTIAEILRRLMAKPTLDGEARDMAAQIVLCLQEINNANEQTISAWEKRGYWMKAERFIREWEWSREMAYNVDDVIRNEAWDLLPRVLMDLAPYFADISIKSMTRKPDTWRAALKYLLKEPPVPSPW
jgi:hypothetical protein